MDTEQEGGDTKPLSHTQWWGRKVLYFIVIDSTELVTASKYIHNLHNKHNRVNILYSNVLTYHHGNHKEYGTNISSIG